ncbi:hypothetical protein GCM10027028_60080 [Streptomyces sundarbansensis]
MLACVERGVGGPLQAAKVAGADHVRGCGADRRGDVDGAAVVQGDRVVQPLDQLLQPELAVGRVQVQDYGELFSELTRASRDQMTGRSVLRGKGRCGAGERLRAVRV